MNLFWYLFNWWLTWTYTDFAAVAWWKAGENWIATFLYLFLTSTILLSGYHGIFSSIFWFVKKFLYSRIRIKRGSGFKETPIVKFISSCYSWWQEKTNNISTKWGRKIAEAMGKHKYWTLFVLNLVPYVPYLSLATIIAAKIKGIRLGIVAILIGNAVKVLYVVGLVYTSSIWLGG